MDRINIGLIGVGGYGKTHLEAIDHYEKNVACHLRAAVVRNEDKYKKLVNRFSSKNVTMYPSFEEMFEKEDNALDLIVIVSGIHEHDVHAAAALENGYHVLCEKPVAGSTPDGIRMRDAKQRSGKILAVGYQNVFSPSIQKIKRMTLSGELGKLIKVKSIHLSPRTSAYYGRNEWAGRMAVDGKPVMDSPLQNAGAHYVQNMLYVAGPTAHESAIPDNVYGECYRVKPVECADTQFIRVKTQEGVEMTAMGSHAVREDRDIEMVYYFENGKIVWKGGGNTSVFLKEGDRVLLKEQFDNGDSPIVLNMYQNLFNAIKNNREPLCTIENSLSHSLCIDKLFESSGGVIEVDQAYGEKIEVRKETSEQNIVINGLDHLMDTMYREEKSFFESGAPWGSESRSVRV